MKIRTGYVSNSSSSSFCIIGKTVCSLYEIDACFDKIDQNKEYVIRGLEGCEGENLIFLYGKDVIDIFKKRKIQYEHCDCDLIEIIAHSYDNETLKIPNITLGAECYYGTCDDHRMSLDDFESEYTEKKGN